MEDLLISSVRSGRFNNVDFICFFLFITYGSMQISFFASAKLFLINFSISLSIAVTQNIFSLGSCMFVLPISSSICSIVFLISWSSLFDFSFFLFRKFSNAFCGSCILYFFGLVFCVSINPLSARLPRDSYIFPKGISPSFDIVLALTMPFFRMIEYAVDSYLFSLRLRSNFSIFI